MRCLRYGVRCFGAVLVAGFAATAGAQEYPNKVIRMVVPFPPAGATDNYSRMLAKELQAAFGQTVIVDNKAGAGGNIGAETVARAAADGHTLLFGTSGPLAINQYLYPKLGYDPVKAFAAAVVTHLAKTLPDRFVAKSGGANRVGRIFVDYLRNGAGED